jgi:hypothetical protein
MLQQTLTNFKDFQPIVFSGDTGWMVTGYGISKAALDRYNVDLANEVRP